MIKRYDAGKPNSNDQKGNRVDFLGMIYASYVINKAMLQKLFDFRPIKPAISSYASRTITEVLQWNLRPLEFSLGLSVA